MVMAMRLTPGGREWIAISISIRISMTIRVMPKVHRSRTIFMVGAVHTRGRPRGLQRHEHDQENEQPAMHSFGF